MTLFDLVISYQIRLYFIGYNLNDSTIDGCSIDLL